MVIFYGLPVTIYKICMIYKYKVYILKKKLQLWQPIK